MLISLIVLGLLNFTLTSGYLVRRSRKSDVPFWLYLLAVLLCWMPGAVFLVLFYRDHRKRQQTAASRTLYRTKITLGWITTLLPLLMQAGLSLMIHTQPHRDTYAEIPEICALSLSACLSCMLLVCVHYMEQSTDSKR